MSFSNARRVYVLPSYVFSIYSLVIKFFSYHPLITASKLFILSSSHIFTLKNFTKDATRVQNMPFPAFSQSHVTDKSAGSIVSSQVLRLTLQIVAHCNFFGFVADSLQERRFSSICPTDYKTRKRVYVPRKS
jgi:hypothetical protein